MLVKVINNLVWFDDLNLFRSSIIGLNSINVYSYNSDKMKKSVYILACMGNNYGILLNKNQLKKIAKTSLNLLYMYEIDVEACNDLYYQELNKSIPNNVLYKDIIHYIQSIANKEYKLHFLEEKKNTKLKKRDNELCYVINGRIN